MKRVIFIALAALTLAVFAVPEAQGNDGKTLSMSLSGSNFSTSDEDGRPTLVDGRVLTAILSGIAKGSGNPLWSSQIVLEEIPQELSQIPPDCLAAGLAGGPVSFQGVVFTYDDGSILSIASATDTLAGFYCTSGPGFFTVHVGGIVTGGDGRFEGATGTWEATGRAVDSRTIAEVIIDLD
jgi:hypothetical protein